MAGTPLYDFGDLVRNAGVACPEDEPDHSKIIVDHERLIQVSKGFVEGSAGFMNSAEVELLPRSPAVLAATLGVRFLADFLKGDKYFKIKHPTHNLQRARTQFAIARRFLGEESVIADIVK
jgi:hypothetical protein